MRNTRLSRLSMRGWKETETPKKSRSKFPWQHFCQGGSGIWDNPETCGRCRKLCVFNVCTINVSGADENKKYDCAWKDTTQQISLTLWRVFGVVFMNQSPEKCMNGFEAWISANSSCFQPKTRPNLTMTTSLAIPYWSWLIWTGPETQTRPGKISKQT